MYQDYFQLKENPFALTPDPRFLFLSHQHREALAHLLYGMGEMGGFVQITGEVGTGKTTLCRSLLEQVPHLVDVALILNPKQSSTELVASICDELGVDYPRETASTKVVVDCLNRHLLGAHAAGRRTVLVVDEAQNLSAELLEQVRLLTNLETTTHKLLQILLIGQPELRSLMARPELRQLSQRITARYHLGPLRPAETRAYIEHRLDVAGCHRPLFGPSAIGLIHRLSGGVPRLINIICDRSLLGAYARRQMTVSKPLIRRASEEITGEPVRSNRRLLRRLTTAGLVLLAALALWHFQPVTALREPVVGTAPRSTGALPPAEVADAPSAPVAAMVGAAAPEQPQGNAPLAGAGAGTGAESPPLPKIPTDDIPPPLELVAAIQEPPPESPADGLPQQECPSTTAGAASQEQAAPAAPANPAPPAFSELLESGRLPTGTETAFSALFRQWDIDYSALAGGTACERASAAGLRCFHDRGNWNTLYNYNRPAVLELVDDAHRLHDVVLVGMRGEELVLEFDGRPAVFHRREIEPHWFGEFILLWKPSSERVAVLGKKSVGPEVRHLRQLLDRAEGTAGGAETGGGLFDDALERRVIEFQTRNRLTPDGLVGEQTWLLLNTAAGQPPTPVLRPAAE